MSTSGSSSSTVTVGGVVISSKKGTLKAASKLDNFGSSGVKQKVASTDVVKDVLHQKNKTGPYSSGANTPAPVPNQKVEPMENGPAEPKMAKSGDASNDAMSEEMAPDGFRASSTSRFGINGNSDRKATISISYKNLKNGAVDELITNYGRFILQSVSESTQEKYQIVETFTNYYIYFFGKRPEIYNFSGTLLNTEYYKWANDMEHIYQTMLRGTKLAEINGTAIIEYDGKVVKGYPIQFSMNKDAMNDQGIPFSFSMVIVEVSPLPKSSEIESFIAEAEAKFRAIEEEKRKYLSRLSQYIPPKAAAVAAQVTNEQIAPSSVGVPPLLAPISQEVKPQSMLDFSNQSFNNLGRSETLPILSPVTFSSVAKK